MHNDNMGMEWRQFVEQVIGDDRQIDVARKTGVDQTTISRWLNPKEKAIRLSSQAVASFARGYGVPVLQAFVVAGFLTKDEADMKDGQLVPDLQAIPESAFAAEAHRRLLAARLGNAS
jgi:transcriptional regulator with XRE-family HTH domain